ncbi:ATP-dependent Clp protease proteolytic subunit-related protein 4 chloroplastic [Bienertia sinuspersici]
MWILHILIKILVGILILVKLLEPPHDDARIQPKRGTIFVGLRIEDNICSDLKVKLFSRHVGKTAEVIEADIRRPKYFSPTEAVEYGIIDKVLYNERSTEDKGVIADLKKAQFI